MGKISVNLGDMLRLMRVDNQFLDVPPFKVVNCRCGSFPVYCIFSFRLGDNLKDIDYRVDFLCEKCFLSTI